MALATILANRVVRFPRSLSRPFLIAAMLAWHQAANAQAADFMDTCERLSSEAGLKDLDVAEARFVPPAPPAGEMTNRIESPKGGKVLLVHGWSDPSLSPMGLIKWYKALEHDNDASQNRSTDSFARLFLFPG